MDEVDIFMAKLVRKVPSQPWGLRIEGGYNTGHPLRISAVAPGSPAGSIGLKPGDVITKIFDRQTKFLSHQQAADIIGAVKNDALTLTIERNASAEPPGYNCPEQHQQQQQHQHESYPHHFNPQTTFSQTSPKAYKGTALMNFSPPQEPPKKSPSSYGAQSDGGDDDDDVDYVIPQSRTFKRLQNFMENNQPLGAAGLPPPRSAAMEQMKLQQQRSQGQGRVKVIMPQKYNNPLKLYSADNVIDTFSSQVGSILNTYNQ